MNGNSFPSRVRIVEVGPRDGLQNEAAFMPTADKIAFVNRLADAGHTTIEVSAFVSPRWVPQMADAPRSARGSRGGPASDTRRSCRTCRGWRAPARPRVDEVAVFPAASETFSKRNINQTIDEALAQAKQVCDEARTMQLPVRAYLSTSFGCPFEGAVAPSRVAELTARLIDLGAYEVSISDTIGVAHPRQVSDVLGHVMQRVPASQLALHFHDTRGTALVNVYAGLEAGVASSMRRPADWADVRTHRAPPATSRPRISLYLLDGLGIATGVQLEGVAAASRAIEPLVGHPLPSRVFRALAGHTRARLGSPPCRS